MFLHLINSLKIMVFNLNKFTFILQIFKDFHYQEDYS